MSDTSEDTTSLSTPRRSSIGSHRLNPNEDGRGTLLQTKRNVMKQRGSLSRRVFGRVSMQRAGRRADGSARYVPVYHPPKTILEAYLAGDGGEGDADTVDTHLLLLKDIVRFDAEMGEVEGYRPPKPPPGTPGMERDLVLDDMVVNMYGYTDNNPAARQLLNETPDYVLAFEDPVTAEESTRESLASIKWDGSGALDRSVVRHTENVLDRYDYHRRIVIGALRKVGLIVKQEQRGHTIYALVWGPEEVLEQRAEDLGIEIPLKAGHDTKRFLTEYGHPTQPGKKLHGPTDLCSIVTKHEEAQLSGSLSRPFVVEDRWMFKRLEPSMRLRLIRSLIADARDEGGAGLPVERLVAQKKVAKFFPVHDRYEQAVLRRDWVFGLSPIQPINRVRAYFGEKVAVYFAWLGFYTAWLWIPAVLGVTTFMYGVSKDSLDNELTPWYAMLLACWITWFMEFWKRYQCALAFRFNMTDYKEEERPQPSFVGEPTYGFYAPRGAGFIRLDPEAYDRLDIKRSAVPAEDYSPGVYRGIRMAVSTLVLVFSVGISMVITFSILALRAHLSDVVDGIFEPDFDPDATRWGAIAAGVLMGITIAVLNAVFKIIARKLTVWENHRTLSQFENSLVIKLFVFQSFNSYASLFYTAFLKEEGIIDEWFGVRDKCNVDGCLPELSYQLGSIMITQLLMGQLIENAIPFALRHGRMAFMKADSKLKEYEKQAALDESQGTIDEYGEMVLQIGYVALFAAAFPLGALLALLNNIIEMRTDANKMLTLNRRPHWQGASDIGPWYYLVQFIGLVSVITNATIVAFVSTQLEETYFGDGTVSNEERWVVALVAEHIILFIKMIIMWATPDTPALVAKYMALEEYSDRVTLKERQFRKQYSWGSTPVASDAPVMLDRAAASNKKDTSLSNSRASNVSYDSSDDYEYDNTSSDYDYDYTYTTESTYY